MTLRPHSVKKRKIKNCLKSQKCSIVTRKLFEMLKTMDSLKGNLKFCVTFICGLHYDRKSRIKCQKYLDQ